MGAPIVAPELQWSDANGKPLAGGTITTYAMGTTTPKATWLDPALSALNPNPVVLDAAGRSVMYGDGDYRLVLKDILGNLIFDGPATTIVSAAMEPVVAAPTIADALSLLGVNALISAEATARANADAWEANTRSAQDIALQNNIDTEATARFNADGTLYAEFTAEDANLQAQINAIPPPIAHAVTMQSGTSTSDSSGNIAVTYPVPFTLQAMQFIAVIPGNPNVWYDPNAGGTAHVGISATIGRLVSDPADDGVLVPVPGAAFSWYVIGL